MVKKFTIEVEEGITDGCDICPFQTALLGACKNPPKLSCLNYDLATIKIKTEEGIKKEMIRDAVKWMYNYLVIKHSIMSSAGFGVFEQEFIKEMEEQQ